MCSWWQCCLAPLATGGPLFCSPVSAAVLGVLSVSGFGCSAPLTRCFEVGFYIGVEGSVAV